jgi:hypothetical protein
VEYYSTTKKKENLPFPTCANIESIILNEISQTQKDKCHIISLICAVSKNLIKSNRIVLSGAEGEAGSKNEMIDFQLYNE